MLVGLVVLSAGSAQAAGPNSGANAALIQPDGKTVKAAGGGLRVVTRMIGDPHGISWRTHH